jgi:hypothetical protein
MSCVSRTSALRLSEMSTEGDAKYITLPDISPEEWARIKLLAQKLYDSGHHKGDQFKCAVAAFVEWIASQERGFAIDSDPNEMYH